MKRMSASNVLIVGLDGLGIEIGEQRSFAFTPTKADFICSEEHCPRWCQVTNDFRP